MKILALVGSTGSGKTSLSIDVAQAINADIFSLDSLSVYKQIDIASAKPSKYLQSLVKHYGLDLIEPNGAINAFEIKQELIKSLKRSHSLGKNILIVGGSSFYLKSIINGLSPSPHQIAEKLKNIANNNLIFESKKLKEAIIKEKYNFLSKVDSKYCLEINQNDTYRINKALEILEYGLTVSDFFKAFPPEPFSNFLETTKLAKEIQIFNLLVDKEINTKSILERTNCMLKSGLIEECKNLINNYGLDILPLKSIGLKETVLFLQNQINLKDLENLISTHTIQLAKRQRTFNRTQFKNIKLVQNKYEILKDIH